MAANSPQTTATFTQLHSPSMNPPLNASSSPPPTSANRMVPTNQDIEAVIQAATSASNPHSPAPVRDTRTQLYVGNLPYRVRWQDLKDLFRKAGTVLRADVSLGPDNRSRGYGSVLLASAEDASRALEMFNGFSWQTRTLEVRADRIPPDLDLSNPLNTLQFQQKSGGPLIPMQFIPPINGAFVQQDPAIMMQLTGHLPPSLPQSPMPHGSGFPSGTPFDTSPQGRNLFVGNLPFNIQWQDLKDLFRAAGQIVRADVAVGTDGRSRGFGTVQFANDADAATAVAMFNGFEFHGRTLKVHHDKYFPSDLASQPIPSPVPTHHPFRTLTPVTPVSATFPSPSQPSQQQHSQLPPSQSGMHIVFPPQPGIHTPYFTFASQPGTPYDQFPPHVPPSVGADFRLSPALPGTSYALHNQHLQYLQHLQQSLPTPPPLHQPPAAHSSGSSQAPLQGTDSQPSSKPSSAEQIPTLSTRGSDSPSALPSSAGTTQTLPKMDGTAGQPAKSSPAGVSGSRQGPGTIALPSQSFTPNILSPLMTRGLPPVTPSMPGFNFHAPLSTPPLPHHFLSPGLGPFSPPMPYYNPYLNVAPGAPVHGSVHQQSQSHLSNVFGGFGPFTPQGPGPQDPLYFPPTIPGSVHGGNNDSGYFPPVPQLGGSEPKDYFGNSASTALDSGRSSQTNSSFSSRDSNSPYGDSASTSTSTGTTSGNGGRRHHHASSSRGTSIAENGEDIPIQSYSDGIASALLSGHSTRLKSSSPHDLLIGAGTSSSHSNSQTPPQQPNSIAPAARNSVMNSSDISNGGVNIPAAARRASWTDIGGLRRAVAEMSLVSKGRVHSGNHGN